MSEPDAILTRLGRFVAELACERLPQEIVQKARACLLYALAVGIASVRLPQPTQAARAIDLESPADAEGAIRLINGRRLDFPAAAFCNSVLLHSRIQDDAHPCGHLGVVVVPATLACAERFEASGADTLAALVAGYEVALRIGRDHAADLSERGFRTTPAYGVFGAAASAARLMRLDAQACANALSLAANAGAGLREWADAGTGEYPFQAGLAARNGLLCANLAAAGTIAAQSALTGHAGFFRAYATESDRYARRVCEGLGDTFEMQAIACKPYPICQFLSAVVDGAIELAARARHREVRTLVVHMHPFEADFVGNRYAGPYTSFQQTMISAPFCAALGWVRGSVTHAGLHEFDNPAVLALVAKINIVADLSRPRYSPQLTATLDDMTVLEWQTTVGAHAYALTWETALKMNAALCTEAGVSERAAQALAAAVAELGQAANVRRVVAEAADCAAEAQAVIPDRAIA